MDRIGHLLVSATLLASACGPATPPSECDSTSFQALILSQRLRYPAMQLDDVLKLVQQASTGSEHWVHEGDAQRWMDSEWFALGPGPAEPLIDTLGRTGRFARINLRPYRSAGGRPGPLLMAFVRTGQQAPDTAARQCALTALMSLASANRLPWSPADVAARLQAWAAAGYPPVAHSAEYVAHYAPAYRVVALTELPLLIAPLRAAVDSASPRVAPN